MLYELLIVITTLAILIKASDIFVEAAAKIAKFLNISEFVIGLTIVAIGTSLPELATSIMAAIADKGGIIIGNVVGSNIANIGLILGISAILAPLAVERKIFNREGKFLFFVTFLFFAFSLNHYFGRIQGIIFLGLFAAYLIYLSGLSPQKRIINFGSFLRESYNLEGVLSIKTYLKVFANGMDYVSYKKLTEGKIDVKPSGKNISKIKKGLALQIIKQILLIFLSGAAIFISVKYMIPAASDLAMDLGVSETIIGLTLIAVGTSLPELMVSLMSVKKGKGNMLLGTIVGSNISNLLLIIGVSSIIAPLQLSNVALYYYTPVMIAMTFLMLSLIRVGWALRFFHGLIMLLFYAAFMISLAIFRF